MQADGNNGQFGVDIQRECVRLYFENLHCVHPVLDRASFLTRCEKHAWFSGEHDVTILMPRLKREEKRFFALFSIVLAIGAVTAEDTSLLTDDRTFKFLQDQGADNAFADDPPYPPIRLGHVYFEKAKTLLDDAFESTSFETAQTLFLMVRIVQLHSLYANANLAGCILSKRSKTT